MSKPLSVYLIGAARKVFGWSPAKRGIKDRCKVGKKFKCELCKKIVAKIQVDHVIPIGKAPRDWQGWDEWYKKLFCSIDNLQGLCVECHKAKSKKETGERAEQRKLDKLFCHHDDSSWCTDKCPKRSV